MRFNKHLNNLTVYEAGKPIELVVREYGIKPEDVIKLASNENPYGTSPKVVEVIRSIATQMFRYPDDSMFELKEALANRFNVSSNNIIIGAGSDQIIEFCVHAKCNENSKVLMARTTFAMYEIYAKQTGANIIKTPNHEHKIEEFKELYHKEKPDLIFLCLPNNPLGECLSKDEVYSFLDEVSSECFVVIDGAYQEYATLKDSSKKIDPKDLIERYPNSIFLGTFSKAYGLGGMRVGYGIAREEIIKVLFKLRPPFNITTLSLKAAIEALKDNEFVNFSIADCFKEMIRYEEFAKSHNIATIPSYTNFITYILDEIDSSHLSQWLLERGVIIRNLKSYGVNGVRITIGKEHENSRFFEMFENYLTNRGQ